jgi:hypothetical protein
MIDKIRFSKKNLSDSEIKKVVAKNNLTIHYADGLAHWHNDKTKNFNGGLSIKIDKNRTLVIEGSLHKYSTYLKTKKLDNYNRFGMDEAKDTYNKMVSNLGFDPLNTSVALYEIGINILTEIEPKTVLKNILSIGSNDKEKLFYIDPKYKNQSQKITEYHKDFRLVFKVYDKIHEMKDNKKEFPKDTKIIRIETIQKRVEKTFLIDFFSDANLKRLQSHFFDNWDKLNFNVEIIAPPKTSFSKIEMAKKLYQQNKTEILEELLKEYKNNHLSVKIYYTLKRFIENWETEKINFILAKSAVLSYWEKVYNAEKQLYKQKIKI